MKPQEVLEVTWKPVHIGVAVIAVFVLVEAGLAGKDGCGERPAVLPDLGDVLPVFALGYGLAVERGVTDQAHFDWLAGQTEVDHDFGVAAGERQALIDIGISPTPMCAH